jgi:hypothetical protein
LAGGNEGKGDQIPFLHPHPFPPPSKGEGMRPGKFQISLASIKAKKYIAKKEWTGKGGVTFLLTERRRKNIKKYGSGKR